MTSFFSAEQMADLGDGQIKMLLVGAKREGRQLAVLREIYPPGSDTGTDFIEHDGEEGGVIIRGEIEITVGSHTRVLKAGDSYYFETRKPHRFRTRERSNVNLLVRRHLQLSKSIPPVTYGEAMLRHFSFLQTITNSFKAGQRISIFHLLICK